MPQPIFSCRMYMAIAGVLLMATLNGRAQEERQQHTCTFNVAGEFAFPEGQDGKNFHNGWGIQAGGGFALRRLAEPGRGNDYFVTANFMYDKFKATDTALNAALKANPTQLSGATSAHGNFSAVTLDPTVRRSLNRQFSLYGLGGFGWFRRGVSFNNTSSPPNLLLASSLVVGRLAADSGVFDIGGGANFGFRKNGGLMLFAEFRVYRGLAINGASTLIPLSLGARW